MTAAWVSVARRPRLGLHRLINAPLVITRVLTAHLKYSVKFYLNAAEPGPSIEGGHFARAWHGVAVAVGNEQDRAPLLVLPGHDENAPEAWEHSCHRFQHPLEVSDDKHKGLDRLLPRNRGVH